MIRFQRLLCAFPVLLTLSACQGSQSVSQSKYGDKWPFTVTQGTLDCTVVALPGVLVANSPKAVTLKSGENTYAINGAARTHAEKFGYKDLNEIWKDDSTGGKVPIPDEIIQKGLEFCK